MRISLAVSDLGTGGAERTAAALANRWSSVGHDVQLLMTSRTPPRIEYAVDPSVTLETVGGATPANGHVIDRTIALRHHLRAFRPDFALSFLTNVNVRTISALAGSGIPVVVSERTYPPMYDPGLALRAARRLTYPSADMVVLQSPEALAWLNRAIPRAKGCVLPNPVGYPVVAVGGGSAPSSHPGRRQLIAVGRLSEEKRFALLIDGFARAAPQLAEWDLTIVGDGPERVALETQVMALNMADRIALPGASGDLDRWYRSADGFVMTSRVEGFPNVLVEALSYGLPVLAADCLTGPRAMIDEGNNGLLMPVDSDADAVASWLVRFARAEWGDLSASAIAIRQRYALPTIADQWIALFNQILSRQAA